jgi:hypothetical protein
MGIDIDFGAGLSPSLRRGRELSLSPGLASIDLRQGAADDCDLPGLGVLVGHSAARSPFNRERAKTDLSIRLSD